MVDQNKCVGCRMCQVACPWEMMTFDESAGKASKCFLCNGAPECVQACTTGAFRYVSWRDLSKAIPIRRGAFPVTRDYKSAGCGKLSFYREIIIMPTYGGWTGKTLRVNLSSGKISTEDTIAKYKDYLGGKGVGYRVLGTKCPPGPRVSTSQ